MVNTSNFLVELDVLTFSPTIFQQLFAEVFEHLAAIPGTVTARFRAGRHLLVVRILLAGCGAVVAALGTAFQHVGGERALTGAQRRTCLAAFRTVD